MKERRIYIKMSKRFLSWVIIISVVFLLQIILRYIHIVTMETVSFSVYVEFLVVNLAWITSLSIPIAGLFASTGTYTSILKSISSKPQWLPSLHRFSRFLYPSFALGGIIAIISLVIIVSIVPNTNKRARALFWEIQRGESMPERF